MFKFFSGVVLLALLIPSPQSSKPGETVAFPLEEATIAQMQQWMRDGRYTSRLLTDAYLSRIEAIDRRGPTLRAVIEINPDARSIADSRDRERREKKLRGPLHGIPIVIKDNIDTADRMQTTAGSLALEGMPAPADAFIVTRLRAAGAVILGKTNMSEWANFRSTRSTSGWSARGGLVRNPYLLDRNACGSSSGTAAAVSANLAAAGIGTETNGSIVCPSAATGLVGIKPTVGLASRTGIVPISHTQDTAGPMARTVADAAALLTAMAGVDTGDPTTVASRPYAARQYEKSLDAGALRGARIGVARRHYFGYHPQTDALVNRAIADMKAKGAVIVDPADISTDPADIANPDGLQSCQMPILLTEFKVYLNSYLTRRGPTTRVHSLEELIAFNEREKARELPYFGQELFVQAQRTEGLGSEAYQAALARCRELSRTAGIDLPMEKYRLDALVAPTGAPAWRTDLSRGDTFLGSSAGPAAIAGYPSVTVPAGFVGRLPVGISFFGRAWSEPRLIALAYAYEQATKHRKPPTFQER
jgi:amidase